MPNFAITLFVQDGAAALPPPFDQEFLNVAASASIGYNIALEALLQVLETVLPRSEFVRFDTFTVLNAVVSDPAAAGFSNVRDACIVPDTQGGALCSSPNAFLFWDGFHLSTVAHVLLAQKALQALALD